MAQSLNLEAIKCEPSQFASEFCEFYCSIIQNVYNLKCHEFLKDVMSELKDIRRLKYNIAHSEKTSFFGDVEYESNAVRCAYMYAYSVLITSVVYRDFSKHLEENKDDKLLLQHFSSKTLKLCCLGGGAGIEAVGVSRAIHDIIWKSQCENTDSQVDLHVTIVDICSKWKSEQDAIVHELNKNSGWFHSIRVNFHFEFFEADLLKPFEETLQNIIQEANIILTVKCVNAVHAESQLLSECIEKLQVMMQSVIDCMAEESCLFILDAAGGSVFYRVASVTSQYESVFQRQMIKHKLRRLHPRETLKRLEGVLISTGFPKADILLPTPLTRVSSCIWIKKTISTEEDKAEAERRKEEKEQRKKEKMERRKEKKEMEKNERKVKGEGEDKTDADKEKLEKEKKDKRKWKRKEKKREKAEKEKEKFNKEEGQDTTDAKKEKIEKEKKERLKEKRERKREEKKRQKAEKEKEKFNKEEGEGEDKTDAEKEKVEKEKK